MQQRHMLTGILIALALLPASAASAESGAEVFARMDESMHRAIDQVFEYDIVNEDAGREPRLMRIRVQVKGPLRMTEFLAPGDMKGTRALVRSRTQMYIYLPAYNKVRRIASHMTTGGFMGTTFSNEDISASTYGDSYAGRLLGEDDTSWRVEGTPHEGAKVAYGRLEMTISKRYIQPTEIRYFDKKGAHIKTETRSSYSCEGDVCNAAVMRMVDHSRNDASTELIRREWQVNTGVDDSVFSVRSLQN